MAINRKTKSKSAPSKEYPPGSLIEFTPEMLAATHQPRRASHGRERFRSAAWSTLAKHLRWYFDIGGLGHTFPESDALIRRLDLYRSDNAKRETGDATRTRGVRYSGNTRTVTRTIVDRKTVQGPVPRISKNVEVAHLQRSDLRENRQEERLLASPLHVKRARKISAALQLMRERGFGEWVETLRDACSRVPFVIEDGGEVAARAPIDGEETMTFDGIKMPVVREPREPKESSFGEREQLHLSNGATMLRGGFVLGDEEGQTARFPGLERVAHAGARELFEESLDYACRAYEACLKLVAPVIDREFEGTEPIGETPERKRATPAEAAKRIRRRGSTERGVSPPYVSKLIKQGKLPTETAPSGRHYIVDNRERPDPQYDLVEDPED